MPTPDSRPKYIAGNHNGEFEGKSCEERPSLRTFFGSNGIVQSKTKFVICVGITLALGFVFALAFLVALLFTTSKILPFLELSVPRDAIHMAQQRSSSFKSGTSLRCGKSAAEARAADCVFDLMSAAWLPLEYFDSELNAEFMELGPWDFYMSNSTEWDLRNTPEQERFQLPTVEAIGDSAELLWTSRRFHIMHCIFGWKMMHRAIEKSWKIEGALATYHHTEHCSTTLANTSVPLDAIMTRVEISFPTC
ncbi:hypothetical protein IFR05_010794 [Cadophora sp. M221]|nr:hypothetical protein IFR05_010794 [Cadophora sp. M221]